MDPRTRRYLVTASLAALIALGAYVRHEELDTHFAHGDDSGVASTMFAMERPGVPRWKVYLDEVNLIPRYWTYAPLQYVVTALLISPSQPYRQILYWGRFPSFVAGVVSLVLMALFCRRLHREEALPHQLLCVALLAFSWENVIYAQQMSSYAIGVGATILACGLLVRFLQAPSLTFRGMAALGLALAVLACAQYQVLFFLPGIFVTLLVAHGRASGDWRGVFRRLSVAGAIVVAAVIPLWTEFIRTVPRKAAYIHWNAGPAGEFAFALPADAGVLGKLAYVARFFVENAYVAIEATIAFSTENGLAFRVAGALAALLVVLGCVALATSEDPIRRHLALFFGITTLTWMGLIVARRLTLGPTRHVLILLPIYAVTISEGVAFLWRRLAPARARTGFLATSVAATVVIALAFLASSPAIREQRRDLFDESWVVRTLAEFGVGSVLQYGFTNNITLMGQVRARIPIGSEMERWPHLEKARTLAMLPPGAVAFAGHRGPLPADLRQLVESNGYRQVFAREAGTDVEVDFSSRTKNGTNGCYFYVFSRTP